jgi:hypothetical protein
MVHAAMSDDPKLPETDPPLETRPMPNPKVAKPTDQVEQSRSGRPPGTDGEMEYRSFEREHLDAGEWPQ